MRFAWLFFILASCGTAAGVPRVDARDAGDEEPVLLPGSTCKGVFETVCATIDGLQSDAMRCVVGVPNQCTQRVSLILLDRHNFSHCPVVVNDANSVEAQRYVTAAKMFAECVRCACDLGCDARDDSAVPCAVESECLPTGLCRQYATADAGTEAGD